MLIAILIFTIEKNEVYVEIKEHIIWTLTQIYTSSALNNKNPHLDKMYNSLRLINSLIEQLKLDSFSLRI